MCHGGDATSQSNDWNQYGVRIVLHAIGAQQPIRLVQDKVWYDGRTQETFNQQLTATNFISSSRLLQSNALSMSFVSFVS